MASAFFNLFRQFATLSQAQLNIFLDACELHVNSIKFCSPVDCVESSLDDLIVFWLFVGGFLFAVKDGVEKINFRFLNLTRLQALPLGLRGRGVHNVLFVGVLSNLDAEHLLRPVQVVPVKVVQVVVVLLVLWRKLRHSELVLSPEELHIQQLVNQVADHFASALHQVFGLAILGDLDAEFAQVVDHLLDGVLRLVLEIFEIYEYTKFAGLHS